MYRGIIPVFADGNVNFIFEAMEKVLVLDGGNAGFLGEVDQFGNGFRLHLLHDPAAVDLNGLEGGAPL